MPPMNTTPQNMRSIKYNLVSFSISNADKTEDEFVSKWKLKVWTWMPPEIIDRMLREAYQLLLDLKQRGGT